tara:strand:+ start:2687 stop:3139 length:453 start_codon:yes stop_codon:yes gene_type:complete
MNKEEFDDIVRKAKEEIDETDIQNILDTIDENHSSFLQNNNLEDIMKTNKLALEENNIKKIEETLEKIINYRLIDEVHEIHKGKNIKYIKNGKLNNGGLVLDVKFMKNGTHVLCKIHNNFIRQYKYDECIFFQQLTTEELLILMSNDLIK